MSQQIAILAIQLGFLVFIAKMFGLAASKLKIPSVMGELVAGIIFGPFCLGSVPLPLPGFEQGLFPRFDGIVGIPLEPKLYSIATLGSIVLLFLSGLETDVRTFFKYSIVGTAVGIGGIICSFLCGVAVGMVVLHWHFMDPRCLFLGILCTATSVGISARILSEHKVMDSPEGVTIMAAAVIDDVLGIVCLAVVIGIANVELNGGSMAWGNIAWITVKSFGIWLGVTAVGLLCAQRIAGFMKWFKSSKIYAIQAFGMSLMLAGLFEEAGLAMIIGAFVMGLSLSKTDVAFKIRATLVPIYNFLVPIFFVVMGMLVDIQVLKDPSVLVVGIIFSLMAILGKIIGCSIPAALMNFNTIGALRVGVGMTPRCEVVLIIAGIAATTMMKNPELSQTLDPAILATLPQQVPIFDSKLFGISIIMPLVTALLAPPMLSAVLSIKGKGVKKEMPDSDQITTKFTFRTEAIATFVLNESVEMLRHDGYSTSAFSRGIRVIQFRKDSTSFSLEIVGSTFVFSSTQEDVHLIKTAVYEAVVELHKNLSELKMLAQPDALKSQLYVGSTSKQPDQGKRHPHTMTLDKIISADNIIVNLTSTTKEEAFRELLELINLNTPLLNPEKCYEDLLEREKIITTYQECGIAMPHTRTDGTETFATAIGIAPQGLDYDPGEEHQAQIVILSVCPNEEPGPYLQFISQVSIVLANETKRNAIIQSTTPSEAAKAFIG